jgi:hypothetical protein
VVKRADEVEKLVPEVDVRLVVRGRVVRGGCFLLVIFTKVFVLQILGRKLHRREIGDRRRCGSTGLNGLAMAAFRHKQFVSPEGRCAIAGRDHQEEERVDGLTRLHEVLAEQESAGGEVGAGAQPVVRICDVVRVLGIASKYCSSAAIKLLLHGLPPRGNMAMAAITDE